MNETPIHVRADRVGRWRIMREGDDRPLSEHDTANEAEAAADRAAGERAEILVHDRYGRVRPAARRFVSTHHS